MLLVRDVFRLKFGKAREALTAFKAVGEYASAHGMDQSATRILTDMVGPYYTLVLETTVENLAAFEERGRRMMGDDEMRKLYQQFTPLVDSGYREIFTIVQ
jgi:hypothetical protein